MTLIGMFHYRRYPQLVYKTYAFASAAKAEGADFFYFTPGKVNLKEETIRGWVLDNREWREKIMPFPDVIYNAGSPTTDTAKSIYNLLYERIPFTSCSIGDKMTVYKLIKKRGEFSQYLIPSQIVTHADTVFQFLAKYNKVIVKPVYGHKGIGVVFIEQQKGGYLVVQEEKVKKNNRHDLKLFLSHLISREDILVQPFISSRTKAGLSYDFRLHVQKNGEGRWVVAAIYPRIASSPQKIVTNLSSGGYTTYLHSFLIQEFQEEFYNVRRYLEQFALSFARHLDNAYDQSLDELGIDVGLDSNRKICLYEVNWRPGVPPTFFYEIDVARNTIRYAMYLAQQKKAGTKQEIG